MTEYQPEQPAPRVRFGPSPHQLLDLPVAESILQMLTDDNPVLMGRYLAAALIGEEARPQRGRPRA